MLKFGTLRINTGVPQTEPMAVFDSQLWASMVEDMAVGVDKGLTVVFRDGTEVRV